MSRYRRAAWQVIAIAAFGGTAALAVVLTRPPPISLTAACQAGGLHAWLGGGAGNGTAADPDAAPRVSATSSAKADVYYTLEFTNISGQTCSMDGYPGVLAFAGGHQIGSPAANDTSVRPSTVTLAAGATAHALLRYTTTGSFHPQACRQVTVRGLRVYPPHIHQAVVVPLTFPACSRTGVEFLSVEPVQPRSGIPGVLRH